MPRFENFGNLRYPFIMIFVGYIIILLLDKLMFEEAHDTKDDDPISDNDDAIEKVFTASPGVQDSESDEDQNPSEGSPNEKR